MKRVNEHPDIALRLGVFPVNRLQLIVIPQDVTKFLLAAALFAMTLGFLRWSQSKTWRTTLDNHGLALGPLTFLCSFILIAFWSATISCVLLGRSIQVYHFGWRAGTLLLYFCFLLGVNVADVILGELIRRSRMKMNGSIGLATAVSAMLVITVAHGASHSTLVAHEAHIKSPFAYLDSLSPSYRKSLSELAIFMENVPDESVVGGFDLSVFVWWLTYRDGYSFLVAPFVSSMPDDELEKRLFLFSKTLQMTADQFIEFIERLDINLFWLGSAKYQATPAYMFGSMDDYTPEQQRRIRSHTARDMWQVMIPQSEIARLRREFETISPAEMSTRRLDVIILTNNDEDRDFSPPLDEWTQAFENGVFRVFLRTS